MQNASDLRGHADQAAGLRRLLEPRVLRVLPLCGTASAVDQARVATRLAAAFGRSGRQVVIVDQSRGAIAAEFRLRARYELAHFLAGDRDWSRVLLRGPNGVLVLPAARGLRDLPDHNAELELMDHLYRLPAAPDLLVVNQAGTSDDCRLADNRCDRLFIAQTGPGGMMPAYREIKRLASRSRLSQVRILLNGAASPAHAQECFGILSSAARRFLGLDLSYCGSIAAGEQQFGSSEGIAGAVSELAVAADNWALREFRPEPQLGEGKPRITQRPAFSAWS